VSFDIAFAFKNILKILSGLPITLLITVVAMSVGLIFGFFLALCRINKVPVLSQLARLYVSYVRGTPLLVQLYLVFYTLPVLSKTVLNYVGIATENITLSPLAVALLCYSLNTAAYLSNVIMASMASVSFEQMEAAYSVGETYWQGMRRIVLPQAFKTAFPTLVNSLLNLIKGTSLAYTIMVVDLMARAKLVAAEGFRYLESYVVCIIIYWLICLTIEKACLFLGSSKS
jgi:L-cystine transport system permease protein